MKNKSGIFSPGLYLEGVRQTRYVGLPFLSLVLLCEAYSWIKILTSEYGFFSPEITLIISFLSFCIVIPICALSLFHFLNSRAASDFYHSIPNKRTALYTSFAASIMTWSVGGVMVSALSELTMGLIVGMRDGAVLVRAIVYAVICGGLVLGACLLGMTLSGNLISQISIIALILFLPRALIALAALDVNSNVATLPSISEHLGSFFNYRINLLFNALFSELFGTSGVHLTWWSILYTAVLGAAYFFIGLRLFNNRKSEKASYPSVSRIVQSAVRVLVAFIVCMLADQEIIAKIADGEYNSIDITAIALIFGLAVIVYFVYEMISSRTVRGLRNSAKELLIGLAVLLAVNAVFIAGTVGMINSARSYVPDRNAVSSVSVTYDDSGYYTPSYLEARASNIEIDDPEAIDIALDVLRHNNQAMQQGLDLSENTYTIRFNMKNGNDKTRILSFTAAEYLKFNEKLVENEQFAAAMKEIPAPDTITSIDTAGLTDEQALAVWNRLSKELEKLRPDERLLLDTRGYEIGHTEITVDRTYLESQTKSTYCVGNITVSGKIGGRTYYQDYRITPLTPDTAEYFMEIVNADNSKTGITIKEFNEFLMNCDKYETYSVNITIDGGNLVDSDGNYIYTETQCFQKYKWKDDKNSAPETYMDMGLQNGGFDRILDELERNYTVSPTVSKPFYNVDIYIEYYDGDGDLQTKSGKMFVNVDPVDPMIMAWVTNSDY